MADEYHDHRHLHALHLQVQSALAEVRHHLEHHSREHEHEAGYVDLLESLHAVQRHLESSQEALSHHDDHHDHSRARVEVENRDEQDERQD
jgi:hypothetical protein